MTLILKIWTTIKLFSRKLALPQFKPYWGIFILSLSLNVCAINWGILEGGETWAADEIVPSDVIHYMNYWRNGFTITEISPLSGDAVPSENAVAGEDPRMLALNPTSTKLLIYPRGHFKLLAIVYVPFLSLKLLTSQKLSSPDLYTLILLGRLLSSFMGAGTIVIVANIGSQLYSRTAGVFAGIMLSLSYPFIYYSHIANVDIPSLFWLMLAIYYFVLSVEENSLNNIILGIVACVFSILSKDNAIFVCIFPILISIGAYLVNTYRNSSLGKFAKINKTIRDLFIIILITLVSYALLQDVFLNFQEAIRHFQILIAHKNYYDYTGYTHLYSQEGYWGLLKEIFFQLSKSLSYVGMATTLLGIGLAFRKLRLSDFITISIILGYVCFVCFTHSTIGIRFALPAIATMSIFSGFLLAKAWNSFVGIGSINKLAICCVFLISFGRAVSMDITMIRDSRYQAEGWIQVNINTIKVIDTFNIRKHTPKFPSTISILNKSHSLPESEYVLITTNDLLSNQVKEAIEKDYFIERHFYTYCPFDLRDIFSVNPEITIYKRRDIQS